MGKSMRIVTWNCQMGFEKKADALLSLNPDVAVVPECSEKSTVALRQRGYETLWLGSNPLSTTVVDSCSGGSRGLQAPEKWQKRRAFRPGPKHVETTTTVVLGG